MTTNLDPVRLRMAAANPAPAGTEPPVGVMAADGLLDLIDERSGDMSRQTETLERPTGQEPRRRWRAAWAFGGTFAVVAAAIVVAAILGSGRADDAVDQPAPTTGAPTTVVVPALATIKWQPVLVEGASRFPFFVDAVSDGERVVAISGDDEGALAAWTSADGLVWEPWEGEDLLRGKVFAGPHGLTRVNAEELFTSQESGFGEVVAVAPGGPGWVAVGRHELDGRVWVSTDAETWQQVESEAFSGAWLRDVVTGGPGLVAVGAFHGIGGGGIEQAAVWVSSDGLQWDLVEEAALAEERRLGSIARNPTDGRLLAFGTTAVWVSEDGFEWSAIHHRDNVVWLSQPPPNADAVWVGNTIVAAGSDVAFSLWMSPDGGATWVRHDPDDPIFGGAVVSALLLHQGRLIAVGSDNAVIWIGEVE